MDENFSEKVCEMYKDKIQILIVSHLICMDHLINLIKRNQSNPIIN